MAWLDTRIFYYYCCYYYYFVFVSPNFVDEWCGFRFGLRALKASCVLERVKRSLPLTQIVQITKSFMTYTQWRTYSSTSTPSSTHMSIVNMLFKSNSTLIFHSNKLSIMRTPTFASLYLFIILVCHGTALIYISRICSLDLRLNRWCFSSSDSEHQNLFLPCCSHCSWNLPCSVINTCSSVKRISS